MAQQFILGIGSGRCGTLSLAHVLDAQPETHASHEDPPLLPWKRESGRTIMEQRFVRWRRRYKDAAVVADVASFHLPYIEEAIAQEPELRVVCLKRPREEVVESFCKWLERINPLAINHWVDRPPPGWHHDPVWTRIFPQYDIEDREQGIRRYWDEYYSRVEELAVRYPDQIRVFGTHEALNTEEGQREMLAFAGYAPEKQVLAVGMHHNRSDAPQRPRMRAAASTEPMDRRRCVVLVPYTGSIEPECEEALKELERRGYAVRRVRGFAAIDQARNQLATDAIIDGYEETFWIDSDIGFHPDAVDRLRSHQQPIVCGIYPQKGKRSLACHALVGTPHLKFGKDGALNEILYAGTGFLLVRREVYLRMQRELGLPACNERFGHPMVPYFQPLVHADEDGAWYLAEDYAFCQRAHTCGYRILADTSIRLWHIGKHRYGWEDAGVDRQRYPAFTLHLEGQPELFKRD
jgi:Sulfotransferase domain